MACEFLGPAPEQQHVVLVSAALVGRVQALIETCEHCNPSAELPFDWVLDGVTGRDPCATEYLLESPAKCPVCSSEITEKTLVTCE